MSGNASFRFLDLTDELVRELEAAIPNVVVGTHYKTGNSVGCIELVDVDVVIQIAEFKRKHRILVKNCDVFVSIASVKHDDTWRAPKTVNYVINIINCPIVFSYTC